MDLLEKVKSDLNKVKCVKCKELIEKGAELCPYCRSKQENPLILAGVCVALFIGLLISAPWENDAAGESRPSEKEELTQNAPELGDTVSTRYFDVTVHSVDLRTTVNVGNSYLNLPQKQGSLYLILDVEVYNTSRESRMMFDGEIVLYVQGEKYRYDQPEQLLSPGYGLDLKTINPLSSIRSKVVFSIPESYRGSVYYNPGRSDKLIYVGGTYEN